MAANNDRKHIELIGAIGLAFSQLKFNTCK